MQLRAKEKARRKKCDVRFSLIKNNGSSRKIHESWCEEVAEDGKVSARAGRQTSASLPRKG